MVYGLLKGGRGGVDTPRAGRGLGVGLYTILTGPILYGVWLTEGGSGGPLPLRVQG